METKVRADGSTYLANTRVVYGARGVFAAPQRDAIVALFHAFDDALREGCADPAHVFGDGPAYEAACAVVPLVRELEARVDRVSGVVPESVMLLRDGANVAQVIVGSPSRVVYDEPEVDEVADRVARALMVLLAALGAESVFAWNID
jgi:hypothetical protein